MSKEKKQGNWLKRHKILTGVLVFVLLMIIVGAGSSDQQNTNTSATNNTNEQPKQEAVTAKLGEPARDGKFEFTVKSVDCGKTRVGDTYFGKDAQGEFCFVNVTIKNIGNEAQSLFADNQYVYDAAGKRYSADSEASIYSSSQVSTWYDEINPGNSVSGAVIFDVPKGTKLTSAELHDSALSGGIKVILN
jgi:hypothetical protein